jgi:hypothetical protein
MSNPTTAEALHDLRAAQALIDRALKTLNAATPVMRQGGALGSQSRSKVPPLLGSNRNPEPEPTDGEEQSAT